MIIIKKNIYQTILTTIILFLLVSNISYSKDNPLKIFKKEILGEEAERMKQGIGALYKST